MEILEVDVGYTNESYYLGIFGAMKYYREANGNSVDSTNELIAAYESKAVEKKPVKEKEFISMTRNYLSARIKLYYEKGPFIKFETIYNDEKIYKELGLEILYTYTNFKGLYNPDSNGNYLKAENSFYSVLGEKIQAGGKNTVIEINALKNLLLDFNYIVIAKRPERPEQLTAIETGKRHLYIINQLEGPCHYFTLTDADKIKVGNPIVSAPKLHTSTTEKNAVPTYDFNKIYDTVDYFKIGVNRHNQFLNKHNLEKQLYHDNNLLTSINNVQTSVTTLDNDINYQLDKQGIELMKQSLKMYTQIQDMNSKNMMKFIELTQEADKQIMELLQVGLKKLTRTQTENIENLLLELHRGLEFQKITTANNMLDLNIATKTASSSVQKSIRENGEAIQKALYNLDKQQIEGFGSIKTNLVKLLGQLEATAKLTESVKPQLASVKNNMERELLKVGSLIERLKQQLEFETQKREKAIKAEQDMRHAQIELEIANRQGDVSDLYDTIYEKQEEVYKRLLDSELESNVEWLIQQIYFAHEEFKYLESQVKGHGH